MATDLQGYADKAKKLVTGGTTPTSAVANVVRGLGLGREKISRVCTMLNRNLLELDKSQAYTKQSGQLWRNRWDTAKPEGVFSILGVGADDTTTDPVRKASAASSEPGLSKTSAPHMSLDQQLQRIIPPAVQIQIPMQKTSSGPSEGHLAEQRAREVVEVHDLLLKVSQAAHVADTHISAAQLGKEQARVDLEIQIDRGVKTTGLTLGEALYAVKMSCGDGDAFVEAFDDTLRRHEVDLDAVVGNVFQPNGLPDEARIKTSQAVLAVRADRVLDSLSGKVLLDAQSPLIKASKAWKRACDDLDNAQDARAYIVEKAQSWRGQAHAVFTDSEG